MPRPGYSSVTLPDTTLADLTEWRATQRPIPSASEAIQVAVAHWMSMSDRERKRAVETWRKLNEK